MNPHSFPESLRLHLAESFSELNIYTAVSGDDRSLPYVLLTLSAGEERILRNHTWECELAVQLHSNAHDLEGDAARQYYSDLCAAVCKDELREALNKSASDFFLYRISLLGVDESQAMDDTFIQTARFRVLIQF